MEMMDEMTKLGDPIDVMYLMHKAFRAQSTKVEELASGLEAGGDLGAFKDAFGFWGKALLYHATAEDEHMTAPLTDSPPARDNETEHAELARQATELVGFMEKGDSAGLAETLQAAVLASEGEQHKELIDKFKAAEKLLTQEIGENRVVARTRRHIYRQIMAMRVAEYDHFENEEAFVVSLVREKIGHDHQVKMTRQLLIDDKADDPRWIIKWVATEVSSQEQKLLSELEDEFKETPAGAR